MQADTDVIVVGGGSAGLSTAGALGRRGVSCVVLEQDAEIGARWASRYDRLRLHTTRSLSGLSHVPLPRRLPRYVTKDDFAAYLRDYAERLELDVRLGQSVVRVHPEHGGWAVETEDRVWRTRVVVLATGRHDRPFLPDWPGRERYRGRLLHSDEYRSGIDFRGRDVLVVGLGNSGAEIAADLADSGARRVAVAVRTVPPISRRDVLGVPVQVLGIAGSLLSVSLADRMAALLRRLGTGDLSRFGLGPAAWGSFSARRPPVIDAGFLRELRQGRIEILPAVAELTPEGALLADGRRESFDAVIAATGYRCALPELLGLPGDELPPGLHAIGFRESARGALFEIRRDSLRLAREIEGELASRAESPEALLRDLPEPSGSEDQVIHREKIQLILR